jgi:hypothetical protein
MSSSRNEAKGTTTDYSSGQMGSTVTPTSIPGESESMDILHSDPILTLDSVQDISETGNTPLAGRSSVPLFPGHPLFPTPEDIIESTTNYAKPIIALERMRRAGRNGESQGRARGRPGMPGSRRRDRQRTAGVDTMDVFAVLAQLNEQLNSAQDLPIFLKIVAGIVKDITQFHRILIYQFDEQWNGQVVTELVDWTQSQDLYNNLHFPASDIPVQVCTISDSSAQTKLLNKARKLYAISECMCASTNTH